MLFASSSMIKVSVFRGESFFIQLLLSYKNFASNKNAAI